MDRLLGYLRQDFGKRHVCLSRQPDGQEVLLFKAMGRNGNWPVEITVEGDGSVAEGASAVSSMPLLISRSAMLRGNTASPSMTRCSDR